MLESTTINPEAAAPWKILVVDDNDDDLFLIRDLLEEEWPGGDHRLYLRGGAPPGGSGCLRSLPF